MTTYKATITIEFDDQELEEFGDTLEPGYVPDIGEALYGLIHNIPFGSGDIEKIEQLGPPGETEE